MVKLFTLRTYSQVGAILFKKGGLTACRQLPYKAYFPLTLEDFLPLPLECLLSRFTSFLARLFCTRSGLLTVLAINHPPLSCLYILKY